jgi:hypothetical protein
MRIKLSLLQEARITNKTNKNSYRIFFCLCQASVLRAINSRAIDNINMPRVSLFPSLHQMAACSPSNVTPTKRTDSTPEKPIFFIKRNKNKEVKTAKNPT